MLDMLPQEFFRSVCWGGLSARCFLTDGGGVRRSVRSRSGRSTTGESASRKGASAGWRLKSRCRRNGWGDGDGVDGINARGIPFART